MFRSGKRRKSAGTSGRGYGACRSRWLCRTICAASCLLSGLSAVTCYGKNSVCDEGQMIQLYETDNNIEIDFYNSEGKKTCTVYDFHGPRAVLEVFKGKIRKQEEIQGEYVNLETGEVIGVYPERRYDVKICHDHMFVHPGQKDVLNIYDAEGSLIADTPCEDQFQVWEHEQGAVIIKTELGEIRPYLLSFETSRFSPISGECFSGKNIEEYEKLWKLGEHYAITGRGHVRIISETWELLDEFSGWVINEGSSVNYALNETGEVEEGFLIVRTGKFDEKEDIHVLNTDMEELLCIGTDDEDEWFEWYRDLLITPELRRHGKFVKTARYEELDGLACEWFLKCGTDHYPCGYDGDMYHIYFKGETIRLRLPDNAVPCGINAQYVSGYREYDSVLLYDYRDNKEIRFPETYEAIDIILNYDGFAVKTRETADDGTTGNFVLLFDNEQREILRIPDGERTFQEWTGGNWYYRNELMDGIIDQNGNWLLRRWSETD